MTQLLPLLVVIAALVALYLAMRKKPQALVRDVARLERGKDAVDRTHEAMEPEGEPVKPQHLRKRVRDARLLPKAGPRQRARDRKKLFEARDARRRFSLTMRSRDRKLSVLAADEEQLQRLGLPVWHHESDLAEALGLTVGRLRYYAMHRIAERTPHYVTFAIAKRAGGQRLIQAPKRGLKAIQRRLVELLMEKLPVHDAVHGFRKARSIKTGAQPHVGKKVLLKLDIKAFFPSVTFGRVRGYLAAMGYGYDVATALAVLCTEPERQPVEVEGRLLHVPVGQRHTPQGAPTSPGLTNALCMRLDRRLAGLARAHGFEYTRYADDITFSGNDIAFLGKLRGRATMIVRAEGFEPNEAKTRVMRAGRRQRVTGVTVNEVLGLSRKERRKLRAALHQADAERMKELEGHVAYVRMLNPGQAGMLRGAANGSS